MKIRKKLILIYIISTLIPIIILGIVLTSRIRNLAIDRAVTEANTNNDRIKARLDELLKVVTDVSDRIYTDVDLQKTVLKEYNSNWEVVDAYSKFKEFDILLRSYKQIKSIRIYVNNDKLLDNSQIIHATPKIKSELWYKSAIGKNGRPLWQYINTGSEKNLSLTRFVKGTYGEIIGVLIITINNDYLKSLIKEEPFDTIITLDQEMVVLAKDDTGNEMSIASMLDFFDKESSERVSYKNDSNIMIKSSLSSIKSDNVFDVFTLMPVRTITSTANQIGLLGFEIIGLSVVIAVVLIIFFSRLFTGRIILLRKEMYRVVSGDLSISNNIKGSDEIGELFRWLNMMIDSINKLIREVYEEKLLKEQLKNKQKEIEFKMLASQINPHFLYNALETIRMEAHYNGQQKIAEVVKTLGKMLRRNLEVSNKLVPLQSEIELVQSYLYIQKFRFEERVSYQIETLTEVGGYYVLPLLIQPIVENAFVHGLENKHSGGVIRVVINREEEFLKILVEDNGIGMDEGRLEFMRNKLVDNESDDGKNIGLCNVNNRIKIYYGNDFGIKLYSEQGAGTKVFIYLPIEGDKNGKSINN